MNNKSYITTIMLATTAVAILAVFVGLSEVGEDAHAMMSNSRCSLDGSECSGDYGPTGASSFSAYWSIH
jgi:hypothetical protein